MNPWLPRVLGCIVFDYLRQHFMLLLSGTGGRRFEESAAHLMELCAVNLEEEEVVAADSAI
jgi:hypothetical protein